MKFTYLAKVLRALLTPMMLFFSGLILGQTCDVDLIGYDPVTHQVSVAILNGENCGCNEFTTVDGNTCGPGSSSVVQNNSSITHFVFGLHIYEDYTQGPCSQSNFHPGWTFAYPVGQSTLQVGNNGLVAGDTLNVELNTFFDWECLLGTELEDGQCWQMVVWQINLSQTADINDFPTEYWTDTCGVCAEQTQMYPDIDLSNNSLVWCPDELPPPPLYPGCIDSEALNYNPSAGYDDGTCEYPPILGCISPTACNYNQFATEDDGSCVFCDTPNGEELCNAYHGEGSEYWDFYVDVFDCEVDMSVDSVYFGYANCDIFFSGSCGPGIRWYTTFSNVSDVAVDSWNFTITGPNGYLVETPEYGVNGFGSPEYNAPLPPYTSGPVINTISSQLEWQQNDTLCVTVNVLGQVDSNLDNNTFCVPIPFEYPVCVYGCTDENALNYDENATCEDLDLCEYPSPDAAGHVTITNDTCFNGIPANVVRILAINPNTGGYNATDTLFNYCIEVPELGLDSCLYGDVNFSDIIPPGEGQVIWEDVILPSDISEITVNVYYAEDENEEFSNNNSITFQNVIQNPDICVVLGCTDPEATNYMEEATDDDGSCEYPITELTYLSAECLIECGQDGFFWYVITTWTNTGDVEITDFCAEWDVLGGDGDIQECWDGNLLQGDTVELQFGPYMNNGSPVAWAYLQVLNGDTLTPQIGNYETLYCYDHSDSLCVYGCIDPMANNFNPDAGYDDGSCTYDVLGCTDEDANNYDSNANVDDGSCTYDVLGCTDETANNYNPNANIDDGSCTYDVLGCTDEDANNYNPNANVDDGSCTYDVLGCTDEDANNYNPNANVDDGSCTYDIYGCTDEDANNYNPNANVDDGSCEYDIFGCTDPEANNYEPTANVDDGSCTYDVFGCTDSEANNYNPLATIDDGTCTYDVYGCTDESANNFNPNANIDDGSCEYDVLGCTDSNANNFNEDANVDDGSCEYDIYGCTDMDAINYNFEATIDDGTCIYPSPCDEFDGLAFAPNAFSPNNDGLNDTWGVLTEDDCWREWSLLIFNRWGQVVFEMDNPSDRWDGSFRGGEYYVQDGVYAYTIRGLAWNLEFIETSGFLTVLR